MIDQRRLLRLHAAQKMDAAGNKHVRREIAMIKVAAPKMLCQILDWAIQAHRAAGVTTDFDLAHQYARARTMRIVDGPDEVHRNQIARMELGSHRQEMDPASLIGREDLDSSLTVSQEFRWALC